jgi:NTE family protein
VRYDVVKEDSFTGLLISTKAKRWGPNYLQFGLSSSNDFEGDTTIRLGAIHTRTAINSLNGEWRTGVQLGDEVGLFTELHQPLEPRLRYFASGLAGYGTNNVNVFDAAGNRVSRYKLETANVELGAGREFGTWGEGRMGYRWGSGHAKVMTGAPAPNIHVGRGEIFLRLSADRFNDVNFPRAGYFGALEWRSAREGLGSSANYNQVVLSYAHAYSWGANTLIGALAGGTTLEDNAPLEGLFPLGGFLRLSGFAQDELRGQHAGLAALVYMRRLSAARFFRSYVGASAELGNVWQNSRDVSFGSAIASGSVFLGLDTPIGPVYVAYGHDERGRQSFYTYVGPRFTF